MIHLFIIVAAFLFAATPSRGQVDVSADDLSAMACQAFLEKDFVLADSLAQRAWVQADSLSTAAGFSALYRAAALTLQGDFDEALGWQDRARSAFASNPHLLGRLQVSRAVTNFLRSQKYSAGEAEEALLDLKEALKILGEKDFRSRALAATILAHSNQPNRAQTGYMTLRRLIKECRAGRRQLACGILSLADGST
jgi:tetratricopeptide (TPR) repeat protein